jgi:regulatory protein
MAMRTDRRPPPPLDGPQLERLALRYVERFATTRGKLASYLSRKLRERGWAGEGAPDPPAIAERMAALGYVDDRGFATARAAAMGRRGLGARRIAGAFREAGIGDDDAAAVAPAIAADAERSALAFARRRRIGPFAAAPADRAGREKALAAMLRAGHGLDMSRRIVALDADALAEFEAEFGTNG